MRRFAVSANSRPGSRRSDTSRCTDVSQASMPSRESTTVSGTSRSITMDAGPESRSNRWRVRRGNGEPFDREGVADGIRVDAHLRRRLDERVGLDATDVGGVGGLELLCPRQDASHVVTVESVGHDHHDTVARHVRGVRATRALACDPCDHCRTRGERALARPGTLGIVDLGVGIARRCPPPCHLGAPKRLLQPVLQPDRAVIRRGDDRTRGGRGVARLCVRDGSDCIDRARALLHREPCRGATPALRRHSGVPAGTVRTTRHRDDVRRRRHAGRVRRRRATRPDHGRAGRDPLEPTTRARRPRRVGCHRRPVHRRRLDVRHTARPATPRSWCRHLAPFGDQGHRRSQRCNARRHLG